MKICIRYATAALLVLTSARPAAAQDLSGVLTLTDVLTRAAAQHPARESADAAFDRARSVSREASSALYPGLFADASGIRFQEPMVVAPLHGFNPQSPPEFDRTLLQGSVSAAYTVFDGGARSARITRANVLVNAAGSGLEVALQSVLASTARTYVTIGAARDVLTSHAQRLEAVEAERRRATQLFEAGKVARIAMLRAEAAVSAARADSAEAAAQRTVAEGELARLTGFDQAMIRRSRLARMDAEGLELLPTAAISILALRFNPEIVRLRGQLHAAELAVTEARSARYPRVQLGGRISEYGSAAGFTNPEWQAGAQVSWQLFTGGARGAASERAVADVRIARADVQLAELRVADAVERAVEAVHSAQSRVAAFTTAAAQQVEVVRIERLSLDAGSGVQSDYLVAEAELFRLRAAATQARAAEIHAHIELARLAGTLSVEWLNSNLERTP